MPELRIYDYVNHPFARVEKALAANTAGVIKAATTAASERAADLGATLHAQLGPIDITADVAIEIGPMDDTPLPSGRPALRVPISWHALHAKRVFPVMNAELTLYPLTATETQLELAGTYDPPLGVIGRAIDDAILHRIAEASVLQLLQQVARFLRDHLEPPFEAVSRL